MLKSIPNNMSKTVPALKEYDAYHVPLQSLFFLKILSI